MKLTRRQATFMRWFFLMVLYLTPRHIAAQAFFTYPLAIKPKVNAHFGEMRTNHFHMGLDLSTDAREDLPLYAPADGYVSRMKIESGGFGRAIYINHSNGTTTLYAHMNKFLADAENYLEKLQYERQTWKIDLAVPAKLIPVKKGQLIGYSGNTGNSLGPHVHFEIRDSKTENCLNPLLFKLPFTDTIPPEIYRIAFYDRAQSIFEQSPIVVELSKRGGRYVAEKLVELPFSKVFVGIQANDRMTGSSNPSGIFSASLEQDGSLLSSFKIENISYDKTRYINGHIDYMAKKKGGPYYQMLFPPKEFDFDLYNLKEGRRFFELGKVPSSFLIKVSDAHGNQVLAEFQAVCKSAVSTTQKFDGKLMAAGRANLYEESQIQFHFNKDAFYDDLHFKVRTYPLNGKSELSPVFQTLPEHIPVHSRFSVQIMPSSNVGKINPDRVLLKRTYKTNTEVKKALENKGFYTAEFRELGSFQLIADLEPPVVSSSMTGGSKVSTGAKIVINVVDNNKVIDQFRATVDGQWIMFEPSGNNYVYVVDEHWPFGEHKLSVVVKDLAGNSTTKDWIINRQ